MLVFPRRHSREGASLFGKNMDSLARNQDAGFSPANSVLPIRHSSESWNPASFTLCKSLDPSFRWDDGIFSLPARSADTFPGQQCAFAGMTIGRNEASQEDA
jgi:hypothetical protein